MIFHVFLLIKGDKGDTFFFVEEGEAIASKVLKIGSAPEIVYHYKPGDYFGELALLRDTPRAANIIAKVIILFSAVKYISFFWILVF